MKLDLRCAAIAYMDDTTWVASSRDNMKRILNTAREFYKTNDSQINSNKSALIIINCKSQQLLPVHAGTNEEEVKPMENNTFVRFLGIWIGSKNHRADTKNRIEQEITNITRALRRKKASKNKHYMFLIEF